MQKTEVVSQDEKQMQLITRSVVKKWRKHQLSFETTYDVVGQTAEGLPQYCCRYRKAAEPEAYVLAEKSQNTDLKVLLLTGWRAVQSHQTKYGDGRIALLDTSGAINLV